MPANHSCAYWLYNAVSRKRCDEALVAAESALKDVEFDTIAFTGVSGSLFAPILAHKMGKEISCVRKSISFTDTHSERKIEGYTHVQKYLIVDDIVSSGCTLVNIIKAIKKENRNAECVGVYTYNGTEGGYITGFAQPSHEIVSNAIRKVAEQLGE